MKKLLLFLSVVFTSAFLFSQSTLLLTWEFGPTSMGPSITANGSPSDTEIISYVTVTNTGTETVTVKTARNELSMVEGTKSQFCWGGVCYSFDTDTSALTITLAPGESTDDFSGHYWPEGTAGVSSIHYTFYEVDNPDNASSVVIMYNSMFSLSSEAGEEISAHQRMLSGYVDDPIHGVIKVHNHADAPLNLIAFKNPVYLVANSENWFWFGGTEYPFGVDTSGMVTIPADTVDESFDAYYDAQGNAGISQIVYVFMDPMMPGSYALYWLQFNAAPSSINEDLAAMTVFSPAYPNPAGSTVMFDYGIPEGVSLTEVVITNMVGSVMQTAELTGLNGTARIDVSGFPGGIYFATLKLDGNEVLTRKLLVQ
jgi:hypothetical protein